MNEASPADGLPFQPAGLVSGHRRAELVFVPHKAENGCLEPLQLAQ
jgi:hypothetical protein